MHLYTRKKLCSRDFKKSMDKYELKAFHPQELQFFFIKVWMIKNLNMKIQCLVQWAQWKHDLQRSGALIEKMQNVGDLMLEFKRYKTWRIEWSYMKVSIYKNEWSNEWAWE